MYLFYIHYTVHFNMSRNKLESHPDARTASPGALVAQPQRVMQGSLRSLGKPSARTGQELRCMLRCLLARVFPLFYIKIPGKNCNDCNHCKDGQKHFEASLEVCGKNKVVFHR